MPAHNGLYDSIEDNQQPKSSLMPRIIRTTNGSQNEKRSTRAPKVSKRWSKLNCFRPERLRMSQERKSGLLSGNSVGGSGNAQRPKSKKKHSSNSISARLNRQACDKENELKVNSLLSLFGKEIKRRWKRLNVIKSIS